MWDRSSPNYSSNRPLFHMGQLPVYVTTLLVMIHAVMLVVMAVAGPRSALRLNLSFISEMAISQGKLWQFVTYAFTNYPNVWAVLGLIMFLIFGRKVESMLGVRRFVKLYSVLVLLPPIVLSIFSLLTNTPAILGFRGASYLIHFCIFIGFIFIEPRALMLFGFLAKWVGVFFVFLISIGLITDRFWMELWMLWLNLAVTYMMLRRWGLPMRFPSIEQPLLNLLPKGKSGGYQHSKRKLKVVRSPKKRRRHRYQSKLAQLSQTPQVPASKGAAASIDHLLEKISKDGIGSLTDEERRQLEQASNQLSDQDKPGS